VNFDDFHRSVRMSAAGTAASAEPSRSAGGAASARSLVAGISGLRQNAAVAIASGGSLLAFCEQERITRVRRDALTPGSLPVEALDAALAAAGGLDPSAVRRYVTAEPGMDLPVALPALQLDHHQAHAATAFYLSPFDTAAVFVCDHHSPSQASVWVGSSDGVRREDWPEAPRSFAAVYSDCAAIFGFRPGGEHQLEALARLDGDDAAHRFDELIGYRDGVLTTTPGWTARVADWIAGPAGASLRQRARITSAFQRHLGSLLLQLLSDVRARTGLGRLALGGGLFYNTWLTTLVRRSNVFDDVFIAPNPGNAGIAAGAALSVANESGERPVAEVSPFLGPEFDSEAVKRTLDNCKLSYDVMDEGTLLDSTAQALAQGELIGWFQGRMEWGHRALGNRSILANPLSPYVLDNLNLYLKHRERHRTYGASIPVERASSFFAGPPVSHFMEYEYEPLDRGRFGALLPEGSRSIRLQTIPVQPDAGSNHLFRRLHERFGEATGVPVLVNTSFNGFREPMVCSPRDAVRVFFGSGLDRLVIGRFVIRK